MTGQRDYLLRVLVDDLEAYDDFVKTVLRSVGNISSMETSFALHEVKALTQVLRDEPCAEEAMKKPRARRTPSLTRAMIAARFPQPVDGRSRRAPAIERCGESRRLSRPHPAGA